MKMGNSVGSVVVVIVVVRTRSVPLCRVRLR